jgi:hypothetical protein
MLAAAIADPVSGDAALLAGIRLASRDKIDGMRPAVIKIEWEAVAFAPERSHESY